jgi:hypothetical protein
MHASVRSCFLAAVGCLTLGGVAIVAQANNPRGEGAGQRPGEPARVIVRAITSAGQPVTDLAPGDLSIRTDGRERKVAGLELVTVPAGGAPAAGAAGTPAVTLPAPYSTNRAAAAAAEPGGREFLLILDEEGIGPGREAPVRAAVAQLASAAAPSDRFSLISLRQGGIELQAAPAAAVADAVGRFVGLGSQNELAGDMVCRSYRAMQTLTGALRSSRAGRTIVMVSPGLLANPKGIEEMARVTGTAANARTPDLCQIRSNDFDQLKAAAAASPASVYILHYVDGLAATQHVRDAHQGIENIAGTVEAELIRFGGGTEPALARVMSETRSYYLATLDQGSAEAMRRVDVRSTREGIRVTARPAGRSAGAGGGPAPKAGSPDDMIRVSAVYRDVPLRATGLLSRTPDGKGLMVMALFEPEDPATKLTAAKVALFDEKGTLKANWNAKADELTSYPVAAAVPVPPGKYRMRVAVMDAAGRAGTTDTDLAIQLTDAAPLQLGSLVLGTDQKSPRLQFTAADPQIIGFLPVYGATKAMKITAVYEVRESERAAPLGAADGNVIDMPGDARMIWGGFGLGPLAPGDYLLRVIVSVDGKQVGTTTRTLRKVGG